MPARRSTSSLASRFSVAAVAAQGDDVRMLDDEKLVRYLAPLAPLDQIALHLERLPVSDAAPDRVVRTYALIARP